MNTSSLFYLKKIKNIFGICHLNDHKSFTLKQEVDTSHKSVVADGQTDSPIAGLAIYAKEMISPTYKQTKVSVQ